MANAVYGLIKNVALLLTAEFLLLKLYILQPFSRLHRDDLLLILVLWRLMACDSVGRHRLPASAKHDPLFPLSWHDDLVPDATSAISN